MESGTTLAILAVVAGAMSATTAVLIKWAATARSPLRSGTVLFLLLMMVAMLGGALVYFLAPSSRSLVAGFWVASALMSASVVVVFASFLREVRRREEGAASVSAGPSAEFVVTVLLLVLLNELLMGWTFSLASGGLAPGISTGFVPLFSAVVTSPWFLFTMAAEMLLTAVFLRDRLPTGVVVILISQSVLMSLSPPALANPTWGAVTIYLGSAVMIGLFVYLMEFIYRHRQLTPALSNYLVRLLAVFSAMMAGLFLWLSYGSVLLFAVSVVVEMVLFFGAVLHPEPFSAGPDVPWQLRPSWALALLAGIFVAEIFMGALLNLQVDPAVYSGIYFTLPLSGPPGTVLFNAVYNGFWFLAGVTASTWFLAMMGTEMGMLVVFKLRETHNVENRIRLLLMMGCYAAFVVFYPSIYFSLFVPSAPGAATVPVLGWSMGLGSYPVAPGVFSAILLTYLITGTLVVLFGRRVICSTFCSAALMYQGTAIDSMKSFNRTEWPAKKYLGSRMSRVYGVTTGLIMGTLVATSVLSYLDSIGAARVYIQGNDPSVFFFAFSFSVLWYVMFVTIPYTGNYNCVTMGWCYTGTIAQAFQKIGFFKLKVHSKEVCKACTTLDCAKACPVGLVNMPGYFRTTGEFRSSKCCGVGNCVGDCPYGNLYISDVRHWVRDRLGLPTRPVPTTRLPMVTKAAVRPGTSASSPSTLTPAPRSAQP
ncbi:MAG TPA: hypothetical protein VK424_08570 [Thermoplasmata archaeon]|nr:hypothetical protein [Thermoplasmata archaeon]